MAQRKAGVDGSGEKDALLSEWLEVEAAIRRWKARTASIKDMALLTRWALSEADRQREADRLTAVDLRLAAAGSAEAYEQAKRNALETAEQFVKGGDRADQEIAALKQQIEKWTAEKMHLERLAKEAQAQLDGMDYARKMLRTLVPTFIKEMHQQQSHIMGNDIRKTIVTYKNGIERLSRCHGKDPKETSSWQDVARDIIRVQREDDVAFEFWNGYVGDPTEEKWNEFRGWCRQMVNIFKDQIAEHESMLAQQMEAVDELLDCYLPK